MQEEISKIELILENCEVITIDGRYIGDFDISNIRHSIRRQASNFIGRIKTCEEFALSIYRDGNLEESTMWTFGEVQDKRKIFDRIHKYNDITSLEIYFADGSKESIYVPWCEDSETNNTYQKSYINNKGDLYLVIGKGLNIEDLWNKETLEDDFGWRIYGCSEI